MAGKRWADLGTGARIGLALAAAVQLSLAAVAWQDLARRPPSQINGRKDVWAAVIAANFVGPLAYFRWGRRT